MKERIAQVREALKNPTVPEEFFELKPELEKSYISMGEIKARNGQGDLLVRGSFSNTQQFANFGGFRVGFIDVMDGDKCVARAVVEHVLVADTFFKDSNPGDSMRKMSKINARPLVDVVALESAMNVCAMLDRPHGETRYGVIREFAVRPEYRGRALGSTLIEFCYNVLERESVDRVFALMAHRASNEVAAHLLQDAMTGKVQATEDEMDVARGFQFHICSTAVQNATKLTARSGLIARLPSLSTAALLVRKLPVEEQKAA